MDLRKIIDSVRPVLRHNRFTNMEILLFQSYLLCFAKFKMLLYDRHKAVYEGCFAKIAETIGPLWKIIENAKADDSDISLEDYIQNIIEELDNYDGDDWFDVFNDLVTEAASTFGRDFMSMQPKEITELVYGISDYKGGNIYNPYGGLASYALVFKAGNRYFGEEIDVKVWCIGTIRLLLSGLSSFSENFVIGDSFKKRDEKFSLVVSTPPYGLRDSATGKESEELLLSYVPDYLDDGGTFIMVGVPSVLFNAQYEKIRRYFTDNNLLESIIRLPDNSMYSASVPLVIIKARKGKNDRMVRFFDASKYFQKSHQRNTILAADIITAYKNHAGITVSVQMIAENGYSWAPGLYEERETERPENFRKWGEIAEYISPEKAVADKGRVINSFFLTTDPLDINMNPPHPEVTMEEIPCNVITEPALLLLASRDGKVKIGYVKASEKDPAYYGKSIYAFHIDEDRFYTRYLAVELSKARIPDYQASFSMYSKREIMDLFIPVVPFDSQVETVKAYVASKPGTELLGKDQADKLYSVLVCGQIDTSTFESRKVTVVETMSEISNIDGILARTRGMIDAVVLNPDNASSYGFVNLYANCKLPIFLVSKKGEGEFEKLFNENEVERLLGGKYFRPGEEDKMLGELRRVLDASATPESLLRNLYKTELNAAKMIDDTFSFESSVYDLAMSFVLSYCDNGNVFAEKSFDDIRKVRDNIIDELKKINAVPADLNDGAICDFLLNRTYKAQNAPGTNYFLYKSLVPLPTAQALCYIKEVSNGIVHQHKGDANLGYSLFHCLMSFVLWTKRKIEEGFFEKQKQIGEYWDRESHSLEEFCPGSVRTIGCLKRGGKDYFYCDNVHIEGKGSQMPAVGMKISINSVKEEQKPFVDDEHRIYFYSKDWSIVLN